MQPVQKKKSPVFYGWIVLIAAWFVYLFNVGLPMYGGSVLNSLMVLDLGMSESALGPAMTVHTALVGLIAPVAGILVKKRGVRFTYILGAVCTLLACAGYLVLPINPFMILLFYGILISACVGGGASLPTQALVIRWFDKNRSLAMGLALTAGAIGGFIAPIIMNKAAAVGGWKAGWIVVAVGAVIAILLSLLLVKNDPADVGEVPDGRGYVDKGKAKTAEEGAELHADLPPMELKAVLRTKEFYIITLVNATHTALYYSIIGYAVIHAIQQGIPASSATLIVSAISAMSLAGRLLTGVVGKFGISSKWTTVAYMLFIALSGVFMFLGGSLPIFLLGGLFAGLGFGVSLVAYPLSFSEFFGDENFAVIYGAATPVATVIGALGPAILGVLSGMMGYALPFLGMGIINFVGMAFCLLLGIPKARYKK